MGNFTEKVMRHPGLIERLRKHTGTAHENETEAADEIERLQLQTQLQADELRRRQIRIVALESGND